MVLLRYGLLAAAVALYAMQFLLVMPLTLDLHAWYAGRTLLAVLSDDNQNLLQRSLLLLFAWEAPR